MRQSLNINISFRAALFWTHLLTGVAASLVILVMSVTGVALAYEKQMLAWSDRRQSVVVPPAGAPALPPARLLAAASAASGGAAPTGITMRSASGAPATVTFDGGRALLVDPHTATTLGEPSPRLRAFFRSMTNWHRWVALEGSSRAVGRAITGAANLGFLFLVLSGIYLWLPSRWTRPQFMHVAWFRPGLSSKARDFNWHNVIGIWSAVPLAIIVAGAVPISYPWASNLVYRLAGEAPPVPPPQVARVGRPGGPGAAARAGSGAPEPRRGDRSDERPAADLSGLDAAWAAAQEQVPGWRSMNLRLGDSAAAPFVISLDLGYGGQPQLRRTVTIDRATGAVVKAESFDDVGPGRRARSWLRFVHTGEYYGLAGQTIAAGVSAGSAVLVYTGIALTSRRLWAWQRRRAPQLLDRAASRGPNLDGAADERQMQRSKGR